MWPASILLLSALGEKSALELFAAGLRGTYKQLAAKGLVPWESAQDIAAIRAP